MRRLRGRILSEASPSPKSELASALCSSDDNGRANEGGRMPSSTGKQVNLLRLLLAPSNLCCFQTLRSRDLRSLLGDLDHAFVHNLTRPRQLVRTFRQTADPIEHESKPCALLFLLKTNGKTGSFIQVKHGNIRILPPYHITLMRPASRRW